MVRVGREDQERREVSIEPVSSARFVLVANILGKKRVQENIVIISGDQLAISETHWTLA